MTKHGLVLTIAVFGEKRWQWWLLMDAFPISRQDLALVWPHLQETLYTNVLYLWLAIIGPASRLIIPTTRRYRVNVPFSMVQERVP